MIGEGRQQARAEGGALGAQALAHVPLKTKVPFYGKAVLGV